MKDLSKSFFFLVVFFLFSSVDLYAQHIISGTVTSAFSNQPLENVQVYIYELHKGTITDDEGNFALKNIPSGEFTITFSFLGYQKANRTLQLGPENNRLSISLEKTTLKGKELLITGSHVESQKNMSLPTTVITNKKMAEEAEPSM